MALTPLDYAVIALYLAAITLFGSWFARFQKTTRDYFLAGRSAPWWAICFTIVATETSTLSLIGVPLTGGFFGKFYIFKAALESKQVLLAVLGLLNSAVAAYYYLRILVVMYMQEPG